MIEIWYPTGGSRISRSGAQALSDRFQHELQFSIETLRNGELAALAIRECPPTPSSEIHNAEDLQKHLRVFHPSQTSLIEIELEDTDSERVDLLVSAYGRLGFERVRKAGISLLYESERPLNRVSRDKRRSWIEAGAVLGGAGGLLLAIWRQARKQREHLAPS